MYELFYSLSDIDDSGSTLDNGINDYRPLFPALVNKRKTRCLLDTGANLPAFYGSKLMFDSFFSGNASYFKSSRIKTAGKDYDCSMYIIRQFRLGCMTRNEMCFKDLHILLIEDNREEYQFLLSASMFSKSRMIIDMNEGWVRIQALHPWMQVVYLKKTDSIKCNILQGIGGEQ